MKKTKEQKTDRRNFMKVSLGACAVVTTACAGTTSSIARGVETKEEISMQDQTEVGQTSGNWWV